jgi:hypothetical protein
MARRIRDGQKGEVEQQAFAKQFVVQGRGIARRRRA